MLFKNRKGFSLIEVLVAMAILVALSTILVPSFLSISQDSKEAKDIIKYDSINVVFERTMSDQEVLTTLEKNNYINTSEPSDDNVIHICFKIGKKGDIDLEQGLLTYKNATIYEDNFTTSKIWLNSYQSLEKKYSADHRDSFDKFLLFTISPKTDKDVAHSNYKIVEQDELPTLLKGKVS